METLIKDLKVSELKELISTAVKTSIEDTMEDLLANSSVIYIQSVREARADYAAGRITKLEDLLNG